MNKKGFTLVEILVAVVITGIVLLVSTSLTTLQQRSISSHQVRIEAQDIFAQIQRSFQNKISCNYNIEGGINNLKAIHNRKKDLLFKLGIPFKKNNFSFNLELSGSTNTDIPNAQTKVLYLKFKLTFQGSKAIKSTFSIDQVISILIQGDDLQGGPLKCFSYDPTIYALSKACTKVGEGPNERQGVFDASGGNLSCQFAHCKYGGFVPNQNRQTCPSGFDSLSIGTFTPKNGDGSSLKQFYLCLDCPSNLGPTANTPKIVYNDPPPPPTPLDTDQLSECPPNYPYAGKYVLVKNNVIGARKDNNLKYLGERCCKKESYTLGYIPKRFPKLLATLGDLPLGVSNGHFGTPSKIIAFVPIPHAGDSGSNFNPKGVVLPYYNIPAGDCVNRPTVGTVSSCSSGYNYEEQKCK